MYLHIGVLKQTLRYFILSSWILYDHDGFLSIYLVGSQSQAGASGFIRFIRPSA